MGEGACELHKGGAMGFYLLGVMITFLINLVLLGITAMSGLSQRVKNLKKLGGYYSIIDGQVSREKPTNGRILFHLADFLLISPLLSWLSVLLTSFRLVQARVNKAPVPERVKEVQFKLASVDLSRVQVKECLNELSLFLTGRKAEFRNPYDDDGLDINSYIVDSGRDGWDVEVELDKNGNTFVRTACDPDFGKHIDTYEYRFEGTRLLARTIEAKHTYLGDEVEYDVKNGVVQEQAYRERCQGGLLSSDEEIVERVEQMHADTEWAEYANPVIRYFVLFRHEDVLDDSDAKKFFRTELERISSGFRHLDTRVQALGFRVGRHDGSPWNDIMRDQEPIPEENYPEVQRLANGEGMERFGISIAEFRAYERVAKDLQLYVSKL